MAQYKLSNIKIYETCYIADCVHLGDQKVDDIRGHSRILIKGVQNTHGTC